MDCDAKPIDAELVDRVFISRLTTFLGDVKGWHDKLLVSHQAEHDRLSTEVERATLAQLQAQRVLEKMRNRYTRALNADDDGVADAIEQAMHKQVAEIEQARHRLTAAQDALKSLPADQGHDDILDFFVALREALTQRTKDAEDDIKRLNAVIRDFFAQVMLTGLPEGVLIEPYLSPAAVARITSDWEHAPLTLHHAAFDPEAVLANDAAIPPLQSIQALRANPQSDWQTGVDSWWGLGAFIAVPPQRQLR